MDFSVLWRFLTSPRVYCSSLHMICMPSPPCTPGFVFNWVYSKGTKSCPHTLTQKIHYSLVKTANHVHIVACHGQCSLSTAAGLSSE